MGKNKICKNRKVNYDRIYTFSNSFFYNILNNHLFDRKKNVTKRNGWLFNWKEEFKQPERDIYKLTIVNNSKIIQGLISLEVKSDHVYMHLVESAPFNKGSEKVYCGVPGNLVAYACKLSFQRGHEGNVSFVSKSQLIEHYIKTLEATHFGGRIMIIETVSALKLINKYFKNL